MTTKHKRNRYGNGDDPTFYQGRDCCRHRVPLGHPCKKCAELLVATKTLPPDLRELPTLIGTGDVVIFDDVIDLSGV